MPKRFGTSWEGKADVRTDRLGGNASAPKRYRRPSHRVLRRRGCRAARLRRRSDPPGHRSRGHRRQRNVHRRRDHPAGLRRRIRRHGQARASRRWALRVCLRGARSCHGSGHRVRRDVGLRHRCDGSGRNLRNPCAERVPRILPHRDGMGAVGSHRHTAHGSSRGAARRTQCARARDRDGVRGGDSSRHRSRHRDLRRSRGPLARGIQPGRGLRGQSGRPTCRSHLGFRGLRGDRALR